MSFMDMFPFNKKKKIPESANSNGVADGQLGDPDDNLHPVDDVIHDSISESIVMTNMGAVDDQFPTADDQRDQGPLEETRSEEFPSGEFIPGSSMSMNTEAIVSSGPHSDDFSIPEPVAGLSMMDRIKSAFSNGKKEPKKKFVEEEHQQQLNPRAFSEQRIEEIIKEIGRQPRPVPLLGKLKPKTQYAVTFGVMISALAFSGALASYQFIQASDFQERAKVGTSLKMLSQRLLSSSQYAVGGSFDAGNKLSEARKQLDAEFAKLLDPSSAFSLDMASHESLKRANDLFTKEINPLVDKIIGMGSFLSNLNANAAKINESTTSMMANTERLMVYLISSGAPQSLISAVSQMNDSIDQIHRSGINLLDASELATAANSSEIEEKLQKSFIQFQAMFGQDFKIDEKGNLVVDDVYGASINNNTTQVDQFAEKLGGVATVFQYKNGDFYRITTSLKKEDGSRAIGTNLGKSNAAFENLKKGQSFAGRDNLFGMLYATQYHPIKNKKGEVIGAFFVGFEATRRAAIESLTQFDQGYRNLEELIKLVENGDPSFGMPPLKGDGAKELLNNIAKQHQEMGAVSKYIETTARPLIEARASLLNMVVNAEAALIAADQFSEEMASNASASLAKLVYSAAAIAVALMALAMMGLVNNRITRREAWESAYKNKANEKDIIEFMTDIGPLEFGNLAVRFTDNTVAMEGITGGIRSTVNEAVMSLSDAMSTVKSTTGSVMASVSESVESSRDLKTSNDRQVQEIDDVVGRVATLTSAIEQVTGNTLLAAKMTQSAKEASDAGASVVSMTNEKMFEIRNSMQDVLKSVKHLGETSHEIGSIVEAIETITDRTQVIAVNASLEASKAGAAGQGFQVLAGEVNRLAEQSNEALRTITALVQRIQGETASTIRVVEESTNSVVDGARLSESANAELTKISTLSESLQGIMKQIRDQSEEQSGNAGYVRESMDRLNALSRDFQSSVARMVNGVQQIDASMGTLQSTVSVFKTEEQDA